MSMTKREAYILGWAYGRIERNIPDSTDYDRSGFKFGQASQYPIEGFAQINNYAINNGYYDSDLDADLICAIGAISNSPDDNAPLSMAKRGTWQLGYFRAKNGGDLSDAPFDIAAARAAKGLTQADLAARLGVNQPTVARWEKGTVTPRPETMEAIKAALASTND